MSCHLWEKEANSADCLKFFTHKASAELLINSFHRQTLRIIKRKKKKDEILSRINENDINPTGSFLELFWRSSKRPSLVSLLFHSLSLRHRSHRRDLLLGVSECRNGTITDTRMSFSTTKLLVFRYRACQQNEIGWREAYIFTLSLIYRNAFIATELQ